MRQINEDGVDDYTALDGRHSGGEPVDDGRCGAAKRLVHETLAELRETDEAADLARARLQGIISLRPI